MRRLLLAELGRLRSRRLTWVAVGLIVVLIGVLQVGVYQSVKPLTTSERAEAQRYYDDAKQQYDLHKQENDAAYQRCLDDGGQPDECPGPPRLESFSRSPLPFDDITSIAVTVSVILSGLMFLFVSASFIGAEYSSGSLSNWLSFIPERGKVFTSKLVVLVGATAVVSALSSALVIGLAAFLVSASGGVAHNVGPVTQMAARGIAVAAICAALGFCISLVARHTVAAVAVVLAYLLTTIVLTILYNVLPGVQEVKPWLPQNNLLAILNNGYQYNDMVATPAAETEGRDMVTRTVSLAHGIWYWLVALAAVVTGSLLVFRRRDVT